MFFDVDRKVQYGGRGVCRWTKRSDIVCLLVFIIIIIIIVIIVIITRTARVVLFSVVSVCVVCLSVCLSLNTITPEPLEISSPNFPGIIPWSKKWTSSTVAIYRWSGRDDLTSLML